MIDDLGWIQSAIQCRARVGVQPACLYMDRQIIPFSLLTLSPFSLVNDRLNGESEGNFAASRLNPAHSLLCSFCLLILTGGVEWSGVKEKYLLLLDCQPTNGGADVYYLSRLLEYASSSLSLSFAIIMGRKLSILSPSRKSLQYSAITLFSYRRSHRGGLTTDRS